MWRPSVFLELSSQSAPVRMALGVLFACCWLVLGSPLNAQTGEIARSDDPYDAWEAGDYPAALEGFLEEQVARPDDPRVWNNLGSARYRLEDFEGAAAAFRRATTSDDPAVRSEALYNLGNVAFRQGALADAVENYKRALELVPEDEDAKWNLEYARRMLEQQQQQSQQPKEEPSPEDQPSEDEESEDGEGEGDKRDSGDGEQNDEGQDGDQGEGEEPNEGENREGGQDTDGDGLPDQTEQSAENPTDPNNPDSDRDGLADGEEDKNRNGRVDPGETDPNDRDSDDDGQPDGAEAQSQMAEGGQSRSGQLSPEQAQRLLDALEEQRPARERGGKKRTRSGKDW